MCFYKNEKWARVNGYYFLSNYGIAALLAMAQITLLTQIL